MGKIFYIIGYICPIIYPEQAIIGPIPTNCWHIDRKQAENLAKGLVLSSITLFYCFQFIFFSYISFGIFLELSAFYIYSYTSITYYSLQIILNNYFVYYLLPFISSHFGVSYGYLYSILYSRIPELMTGNPKTILQYT